MPDDDDYFDDEPAGFGDPLHPDDRIWRHPSEMASVPPPGARSIPDTVDFAPVPRRRHMWGAIAASGLVGAAVAVSVVMATGVGERVVERWNDPEPLPATAEPSATTSTTEPPSAPALAEVAEATQPSMVWITVANGESYEDCAGIVISSDGHLLTDSRPFADATTITVRFHDGSVETGQLVGIDPLTELAVVQVSRDDLVPAELGDPRSLKVGEFALLLGPDETGRTTASAAMVNAVGTPARLDDGVTLYDMIRFASPVPMDMSGGPLLNEAGEVIGVTARAGNGEPDGIATPIDYAVAVALELIRDGRVRHPWLGIEGRRDNGEPIIVRVFPDSPAEAAGLLPDDVILAVDGTPMPSMVAFVTAIRSLRPGDEVTITYRRDGVTADTVAVLGELAPTDDGDAPDAQADAGPGGDDTDPDTPADDADETDDQDDPLDDGGDPGESADTSTGARRP
ncbi:MAG: S1C family serine protease [Acidimicrobiales bacterium]